MTKRVAFSWSVIVLRIYGALHIAAGGYCLLRTEALFQSALFLVRLAGVLMILTGIVALLGKRWRMLSATATALALLLTCLLFFLMLMPVEIDVPHGPPIPAEDGSWAWVGGKDTIAILPQILRTDIPVPVLASTVMLEWLAVAALSEARQEMGSDGPS